MSLRNGSATVFAMTRVLCLLFLTSCASREAVLPRATARVEARAETLPEYDPSLIELPNPVPPVTAMGDHLTVTTWNVRHLGRASFDLRGRRLLDDADVIAFQEVDIAQNGIEALRQIKLGIEDRTKHDMCFAVSVLPSGAGEVYGYIWRNDRLAAITRDGRVKWDCAKTADVVRLTRVNADRIVREPALAVMLFKPTVKPFLLASVHLVPTRKHPEVEVPYLFGAFDDVKLPVIVAGDYNLGPNDRRGGRPAFTVAREKKFSPALQFVRTSLKAKTRDYSQEYDNLWTRGFNVEGVARIDLFREFAALDVKTIRDTISDHAPVTASFTFEPEAP